MPEVTPRSQKLVLPYAAPNLNDLIRARAEAAAQAGVANYLRRIHRRKGGRLRVRDAYSALKAQWATRVLAHAREQRIEHFPNGALFHFHIVEVDRRRDKDNLASGASKFILDGLKHAKVIPDDGWEYVHGLSFSWDVCPTKASVTVTLTEAT
jgi:hypothetical protein